MVKYGWEMQEIYMVHTLMSVCDLYSQDVKNKTMSVEQASFCL